VAEEAEPLVQLAPPVTDVVWSPAIVSQSLEAVFVCRRDDRIWNLRPIHAPSLRLGWGPGIEPGSVVIAAATRYDLRPLVVHSTSWRHEGDRLVLTYLAVVEPPEVLSEYLTAEPVGRADLARGDTLAPPSDIGVAQVIEHAFRHLAWLVVDDPAIGDALPDWTSVLSAYEPEPFRAFGAPPTRGGVS
jgi:hypothetical protein